MKTTTLFAPDYDGRFRRRPVFETFYECTRKAQPLLLLLGKAYKKQGHNRYTERNRKENRQKVLDEINRQLDIMKNGEFSDEDFEASKKPYATHTAASTILPMRLTYITARS